jgi:Ca-activated chloride channel family protein
LALDVAADTPVVESGAARRVVVRALLCPKPAGTAQAKRAPIALAIVLDKSGSMLNGAKMENAKKGAMRALDFLGQRDAASVVVYDDEARVLVPPGPALREDFARAVGNVRPGGSTALYAGVETGAQSIARYVNEGYVPRVLLLSDGLANVGPSSSGELAELGRRFAAREITITTIGVGLDYNEDLMTALAAESGGNSYFARNASSLPEIFARDMEDASSLSARHVTVTLVCGGESVPIKSLGRAGSMGGKSISTLIGNVYGEEKYALFEVEIPSRNGGSPLEAAFVSVEYEDALTGRRHKIESPLSLRFTADGGEALKNRRADIAEQAEIARNAEVREEAVRLADEGRIADASSLLRSRAEEMKSAAAEAPFPAPLMQSEAEALRSLADEVETNGAMSNEQRKETVNKAYIQKNQQSDVVE